MIKDVITLEVGHSIVDAAKLMKKQEIGSIIITKGEKAVGIITERDIVRKAVAEGSIDKRVGDLMSNPLIVVTPDLPIEQAAKVMRENKVKKLIVVDAENNLKGIITETDIVKVIPAWISLLEEKAML